MAVTKKELDKLTTPFPNGTLYQFHIEPLWMVDTEKELIGYIDIQDGEFCLLKDYKHRVKAEKALEGVRYRIVTHLKTTGK